MSWKNGVLAGLAGAAMLLSGCEMNPQTVQTIAGIVTGLLGAGTVGTGPAAPGTTPLAGPLTAGLPLGGQAAPAPAGAAPFAPAGTNPGAGAPAGSLGDRIAQAANNLPDPFPYAPGTENGNLGCADVVSTALENAGVMDRSEHQLAVVGVRGLLRQKGWQDVQDYQSGDVICWEPTSGGRHMHVGIIQVENGVVYAINNSSSQRRVVKVPLDSMNRGINCVLRAPNANA